MNQRKANVEPVVYWVDSSGAMMMAPDTRMKPFIGWRRVECTTVGEIEQFSRRFAAQEFDKFRSMKIEEHLRSQSKRELLRANCKLRLAQGCISPVDEAANRRILASLDRQDANLYKLLANEPDLVRGCLEIERKEQPIGAAAWQGKKRGLQDEELNLIASLTEGVR